MHDFEGVHFVFSMNECHGKHMKLSYKLLMLFTANLQTRCLRVLFRVTMVTAEHVVPVPENHFIFINPEMYSNPLFCTNP